MAALSYQRTRLVRAWTHLERQRGGLGFVGGPGETQIEADRRAIDDQLVRLRAKLAKVVKTRALHRAARAKVPYPIVALVGYTNAGKSTLFNRLTGADVFVKDMLFATLDPTMRKIELPSGDQIIMSDKARAMVVERGQEDWDSEFQRFPRLFQGHEDIPGLTYPTTTFSDSMTVYLGKRKVCLLYTSPSPRD